MATKLFIPVVALSPLSCILIRGVFESTGTCPEIKIKPPAFTAWFFILTSISLPGRFAEGLGAARDAARGEDSEVVHR